MMAVLDIPKKLEEQIESAWGQPLSRAAVEALALEGFRREALSLGQVAELLGTSIDQANGFLQAHGVTGDYTADDLQRDRAALKK
jgi:predicted HTH domain antitoxin